MDGIRLFPQQALISCIGSSVNTHLTFMVHRRDGAVHFDICDFGGVPHQRVMDTVNFIRHLHAVASADNHYAAFDAPSFLFQTDDNPVEFPSVSWEMRKDWTSVRLVPDIYYFQARGYGDFLPEVPDWWSRPDTLVWRGATTGILGLTRHNLDSLPRYRLAGLSRDLGPSIDVALNSVVQATTPDEHDAITDRLQAEDLLRNYIPLEQMRFARYVVDIDGNSNSWNFIQRLRLGACMLKVESGWQQWFVPRLSPWQHYIPIANDLSDFVEQLDWCRTNPDEAARIAAAGRQFALDMRFEDEMVRSARIMFPPVTGQ
jgi:hypothetical protein